MKVLNAIKPLKSFFSQVIDFRLQANRQCLIMNYIKNEGTLYDLMDDLNYYEKENIYKHLCYMLMMAQELCEFTHYDLNFHNILLIKPQKKEKSYSLKNRPIKRLVFEAYQPVIIDLGFAHCRGVSGLQAPMTQTHHFMNPMVFCPYFDLHMLQQDFYDNGLDFFMSKQRARPQPRRDPRMPKLIDKRDHVLHTSLFDFLTKITQCSIYDRTDDDYDNDDHKDTNQWEDVDKWSSVTSRQEKILYAKLQLLTPDLEREYRAVVDLDDQKLLNVLMFWIDKYQNTYKKYNTFHSKYIDYLKKTVY